METNILPLLKPQNIFLNKKRLGPNEDGGYVMPELVLEKCSALFTYGVGNDTRYEEEFERLYNKSVYLFDHTLGNSKWERNNLKFYPEGLGKQDKCQEWYEHYQMLDIKGDIFLKIDIEGAEFDYFLQTDINELNNKVIGLSLELHWIDDSNNRSKAIKILELLKEGFVLCHIHGNNWGELWEYKGFQIPKVLELSFINKKYIEKYEPDNQDYPIKGLDISNHPHKEDYKLDFLKLV
jgi:hypothetical protein